MLEHLYQAVNLYEGVSGLFPEDDRLIEVWLYKLLLNGTRTKVLLRKHFVQTNVS